MQDKPTQKADGSDGQPAAEMVMAKYRADHRYERIPHRDVEGIEAVFRNHDLRRDATIYLLVTDDGEAIHTAWETDDCDACDDNGTVSIRPGTPSETAQQNRRAANCNHANIAREAFHLKSTGRCPNCGRWGIQTTEKQHRGPIDAVALVLENCASCGELRAP